MTGTNGRPEIIIEGSDDIEGPWKDFEFLYKPGNVNNSLPFVGEKHFFSLALFIAWDYKRVKNIRNNIFAAPHQPRLDWQMWFAALGTYHQNPFIMSLTYRLLNGQPEVLNLINTVESPFHNRSPKYIKASIYRYHYTSWSQT